MLADHDVHVWSSSLLLPATVRQRLYQTLSADERDRAAAFRFSEHANAYVVGRGLLRSILARYENVGPDKLEFSYGVKKKPSLRESSIHFNVSHSENLAVYAVAKEPMLGIDVEHIRPLPDLETIARQFFSGGEYDELLALDPDQRCEAFFNCWTRKEAYVKAIGDGLYAPLDGFRVTLKPGRPAVLTQIVGDETAASRWSLFDWRADKEYAGAIAILGKGWRIREESLASIVELTEPRASAIGPDLS